MSDVSPLDGPPADGLERAFRLPEDWDGELADLHQQIVQRMRREAAGLPMNTVQQLLMERIATSYVQAKMREETGVLTMKDIKDQNAAWLAMTQEFNKLLQSGQDKLREALFAEIQTIILNATEEITDPESLRNFRRRLAGDFASIEL